MYVCTVLLSVVSLAKERYQCAVVAVARRELVVWGNRTRREFRQRLRAEPRDYPAGMVSAGPAGIYIKGR